MYFNFKDEPQRNHNSEQTNLLNSHPRLKEISSKTQPGFVFIYSTSNYQIKCTIWNGNLKS